MPDPENLRYFSSLSIVRTQPGHLPEFGSQRYPNLCEKLPPLQLPTILASIGSPPLVLECPNRKKPQRNYLFVRRLDSTEHTYPHTNRNRE